MQPVQPVQPVQPSLFTTSVTASPVIRTPSPKHTPRMYEVRLLDHQGKEMTVGCMATSIQADAHFVRFLDYSVPGSPTVALIPSPRFRGARLL